MVGSFDPRRNSFCNLIDFVSTGVDVPMGDGDAAMDDVEMTDGHDVSKKDKKKKKKAQEQQSEDEDYGDDEEMEDAKAKKKKSKKDNKKKKKKKKQKEEDGNDSPSEIQLDSDDDLSLGSVPMSSSEDEEDDDEEKDAVPSMSTGVSKRASVVDGLKGFQKAINFQPPTNNPQPSTKASSKRRHTLGAALKGFQIDVGALQQQQNESKTDDGDSALDNLTELSKNLPTLSIAGVKHGQTNNHSRRRQSAFDVFLKGDTGNN